MGEFWEMILTPGHPRVEYIANSISPAVVWNFSCVQFFVVDHFSAVPIFYHLCGPRINSI